MNKTDTLQQLDVEIYKLCYQVKHIENKEAEQTLLLQISCFNKAKELIIAIDSLE